MRFFKTAITYQAALTGEARPHGEQILYCCTPSAFPKAEQLQELFYSLHEGGKEYINATWREVREEDIPTDEIHLL